MPGLIIPLYPNSLEQQTISDTPTDFRNSRATRNNLQNLDNYNTSGSSNKPSRNFSSQRRAGTSSRPKLR